MGIVGPDILSKVSINGQFKNPSEYTAVRHRASQRKLARLNQALVERDRLIRHQQIAIDLLTLPRAESLRLVRRARAVVERWRAEGLCSADYIQRWSDILRMLVKSMAAAIESRFRSVDFLDREEQERARSLVEEDAAWFKALRR